MALTLDETLLSAQTSSSRHPVCELIISELDLSEYLTGELSAEWSIDGEPNRLKFTLTHGHLFDPLNTESELSSHIRKGAKVVLRLGENIGGADYWQDQGTFFVQDFKFSHQRGTYPIVSVECEDERYQWTQHTVTAAQVEDSYPEDAIKSLVKEKSSLVDDDFNLPIFDDRFTFDANWVEITLNDIVNDLANRFKYFPKITVDNKVSAVRIDPDAEASSSYSDTTQIIDFTPDDSYSDLVNRITVTGQSLDHIEVIHSEEHLASISGTIGWWGFKKDFYVYYSADQSKTAKFPRLHVVESTASIGFKLAGSVTERIRYVDPENKYCIVEISAPNLIPVLIEALAIYSAGIALPDIARSDGEFVQTGKTFPLGRLVQSVGLNMALIVLGSVTNFQYEIWGQPMGYVRRDYAASANDTDLQQKLGMVIPQKEEGFLCFTPTHCQYVADFELALAMLQRNRVTFSKIAHLKDEVGDVISFPHPYAGNTVKLLITDLTRKYKPSTIGKNDGYFKDEIGGWRL